MRKPTATWIITFFLFFSVRHMGATTENRLSDPPKAPIFWTHAPEKAPLGETTELDSGNLFLEKESDVTLKAYIEPLAIIKPSIFREEALSPGDPTFICEDNGCRKEWTFDFSGKKRSLKETPSLFLSWMQPAISAKPGIHMTVHLKEKEPPFESSTVKAYFSEGSQFSFQIHQKIDLKKQIYVRKKNAYLIRRELGLACDKDWRIGKEKSGLVIQARVDIPLKESKFIQLFSVPIRHPEMIQFSIDKNGNGMRDTFILFDQIKSHFEIRDNQSILTMDLRPAIEALGIDTEKAVLMEPIIFLPGKYEEFMKKNPLHEIIFAKSGSLNDLAFSTDLSAGEMRRHAIELNIANTIEKDFRNKIIGKIDIFATLPNKTAMRWEKMALIERHAAKVEKVSEAPERALKSWHNGDIPLQVFQDITRFRPIGHFGMKERREPITSPRSDRLQEERVNELPTLLEETAPDRHTVKGSSFFYPVKGRLLYFINQTADGILVNGKVAYGDASGTENFSFPARSGFNWLNLPDPENRFIEKLEIQIPHHAFGHSRLNGMGGIFFDVEAFERKADSLDFSTAEWWPNEKDSVFLKEINGLSMKNAERRNLWFPEKHNGRTIVFSLPASDYLMHRELVIPGNLPQPCTLKLIVNDSPVQIISKAPCSLPLKSSEQNIYRLELHLTYLGKEPFIFFPPPYLTVTGLKHTAEKDLQNIRIAIDQNPADIVHGTPPKIDGEWRTVGSIRLSPGAHRVDLSDSDYFRIKSLVLESSTPLSAYGMTEKEDEAGSFLYRLLRKIIQIAIFFFLLMVIYQKKGVIIHAAGKSINYFLKRYALLPDSFGLLFWGTAVCALFIARFQMAEDSSVKGFKTITIAALMALHHLSGIVSLRLSGTFLPRYHKIWKDRSLRLFLWSIILVILTAVLVSMDLFPAGEQMALTAYAVLIAGVAGEIMKMSQGTTPP